jgi:DNA-binding NarL/FixJ family response regulator
MNEDVQAAPPVRHTILLVDDDARVRYNLSLLLRWAGDWEVVGEASDTAGALDLAGALHPNLVLLDRWLADGDSLRLIPRLCALRPAPQIVILTGDVSLKEQEYQAMPCAPICLDKMTPPLALLERLRGLVATGELPPYT